MQRQLPKNFFVGKFFFMKPTYSDLKDPFAFIVLVALCAVAGLVVSLWPTPILSFGWGKTLGNSIYHGLTSQAALMATVYLALAICASAALYWAWKMGDSEIERAQDDILSKENIDMQDLLRRLLLVSPKSVALVFASIILLSTSLYGAANHPSIYSPFADSFDAWQSFVFVLNQAAQGAFFDILETHAIDLQSFLSAKVLRVDPAVHWIFVKFLTIFRAAVSIATLGLFFNMIKLRRLIAKANERRAAADLQAKRLQVELAELRSRARTSAEASAEAVKLQAELTSVNSKIGVLEARHRASSSAELRKLEMLGIEKLSAEAAARNDVIGQLKAERRENQWLREELKRAEDTLMIHRPIRHSYGKSGASSAPVRVLSFGFGRPGVPVTSKEDEQMTTDSVAKT
jgi:hypothetical protein